MKKRTVVTYDSIVNHGKSITLKLEKNKYKIYIPKKSKYLYISFVNNYLSYYFYKKNKEILQGSLFKIKQNAYNSFIEYCDRHFQKT